MSLQQFSVNETVQTKIVFNGHGGRKYSEHWIDATIEAYNSEDDTYDIHVMQARLHRVNPKAIHVPKSFLRKVVKNEDLATIVALGFPKAVAQQYLNMAMGNLDLALSCLNDEQNPVPASSKKGRKTFRKQLSSVYAGPGEHIAGQTAPKLQEAPPVTHSKKGAIPKKDEFDFMVVFNEEGQLGFDIRAAKNGKNAMVGTRKSVFTNENLFSGSLVLQIADEWVVGRKTTDIQRLLEEAILQPPLALRFRGKSWMKQEFTERGTLKILVVAASALYKAATHVTIRINDALLSTNKVKKDKEPTWEEVMMWRSFRPDHNKHAIIRVWQYNKFTSNVCVGRGKLKILSTFDKCHNDTIELKDDKGGIVGILIARTMIQRNRRYYNAPR